MRKSLRSLMTLLAVLALSACFPSEPLDPYGVTLADGEPTFVYAPGCSNKLAFAVQLWDGRSLDASKLWEARAREDHETLTGFVIGEAPPGYDEVVLLQEPLAPDQEYAAAVLWGDKDEEEEAGTSSVVFTPGNLAEGVVKHRRGLLPVEEFHRDFGCED